MICGIWIIPSYLCPTCPISVRVFKVIEFSVPSPSHSADNQVHCFSPFLLFGKQGIISSFY